MSENQPTIRLGYCSCVAPQWDLEALISGAQRFGYEGLEIQTGLDQAHGLEIGAGNEALQQARMRLQQANIALVGLSTRLDITNADEQARQAAIDKGKQYVDMARQMGAPHVSIRGGQLPPGIEVAGVVDYVAESLDELVDHADAAKVNILLQTREGFANTRYIREITKQLYSERMGVAWDVAEPLRDLETLEETYDNFDGTLRVVCVQDLEYSDDRREAHACMWGDGTIRFTRAIEILHDDNWHGFLNVCYTDEDPNEVLKRYADGLFTVLHSVTGTGDTATELLESPQPPE